MKNFYVEYLNAHIKLCQQVFELDSEVQLASSEIAKSISHGNKLLLAGNGGSAADCQHIAAEFTGRFILDRKPLAAISLTTDTSALTCISNDYSYSEVFARQLSAIGRSGDCFIGISTSGNSLNIRNAIRVAKEMNIFTIGLLGNDGGEIGKICDLPIIVPSKVTARVQEIHILVGHSICANVEANLLVEKF